MGPNHPIQQIAFCRFKFDDHFVSPISRSILVEPGGRPFLTLDDAETSPVGRVIYGILSGLLL